jgi:serine/threonine protein kinase/tetratricopeptide (TPR) repeat protein
MTTWNPKANALFLKALELPTPAERKAYLDQACASDEALRAEVEALLEAGARAGDFLEHPAGGPSPIPTVDERPIREGPGSAIGPYKLLERIGEGGFGVVYMAEQQEPIRRKVALKILKPGMDTRQIVARFEAERQALAIMDHPNIAKVFDGGETPSGRPYFVMELVKGVPITEFCDRNHLTPRQRLELFLPVCQAVQHAHQKGIIHRDLKPSNVLVTVHDTAPVVKVIDFGVAKALGQNLTDKTLFTGFAQLVGTPLYMSPEQAGQSGLDIDTRSDIYSLGVLLYELLTGTTPFTKERFQTVAYDEICRIIREEEPPRPSTRLSESKESLPSISALRQTEPAKLTRMVRGELDWIVMKALEKNRNRRYETPNSFALDIQRYLADEPVQACPPSAWYRFRKSVRRNKGAYLAAVVIVCVVILGVIGLIVNNRLVTREKDAKEAALERTVLEKERADQNLARARRAVKEFLLKTGDSPLLKEGDFQTLRKDLLETALPFYQEFVRQKQDDPVLEVERGRAYQDLAVLRTDLGDPERALGELAEAEKIFQLLAQTHADEPAFVFELAGALQDRGVHLSKLNRFDQAEEAWRKAGEMLEPLTVKFPEVSEYRAGFAMSLSNLGDLLRDVARREEAEKLLRRAITLRDQLVKELPDRLDLREQLANSWVTLGAVLSAKRQLGPAEEAYRSALAVLDPKTLEKLPGGAPLPLGIQQVRARAFNNLGSCLRVTGRLPDAEQALRAAVSIKLKLAQTYPSLPRIRRELAGSHHNLGAALQEIGKRGDARTAYEKAVEIRESLVTDFPGIPLYAVDLAGTYKDLGQLIGDEKIEESLPWLDKAVDILERVYRQDPRFVKAREVLCLARWSRAMSLCGLDRFQEALQDWDRAIEVDDGQYQVPLRMRRISNLLNLKDHTRATAEAQTIAESKSAGANDLYNAACAYALSVRLAADDVTRSRAYAEQAVALLRRAIAEGYKDVGQLKKGADLNALRSREDFQKLLRDLEDKKKE